MSDFTPWWDGLSLSLKIYWGIAIPFSLFFVLQLLWSFFGGSDVADDTPDADIASCYWDGTDWTGHTAA